MVSVLSDPERAERYNLTRQGIQVRKIYHRKRLKTTKRVFLFARFFLLFPSSRFVGGVFAKSFWLLFFSRLQQTSIYGMERVR